MSLGTIVLIILVILLLGGFSGVGGGPFYGRGPYLGGGLFGAARGWGFGLFVVAQVTRAIVRLFGMT
jgi:hypothetical protein